MKRIGVEPDWSFEIENVDSVVRRRLTQAPADGQRLMAWKVPTLARVINGWPMNAAMNGFQVASSLIRLPISSWMPLRYNGDGSLVLFVQNESPGRALEANWLPALKGPFNLTIHLYALKAEVMTGRWSPPPIEKITDAQTLAPTSMAVPNC